jgi:uncharacterized protein with FMN-binding domain
MKSGNRRSPTLARNNLVALGTAAVLAVYAAGFDRTRAAAQQFADADAAQRRPAPPSARLGDTLIGSPAPRETIAVAPVEKPVEKPVVYTKESAAVRPPTAAAVVAKGSDSAPAHASEKPAAPLPSPASDSAARTDSSAQKDRGPYKDGTFYGWGRSRHGDIQAGVEITNGHITAAWIEQCLTQYSCSWIAGLPSQVEKRQSAEVDFVSGATQSTNAFYYGVVQALDRAK